MSLIPEKSIVISPTLAATIGLEETVLLQVLQECLTHGSPVQSSGFDWVTVSGTKLLTLTPFWHEDDIRRLSASLHEKGLLLMGGGPFSAQLDFRFAFNELKTSSARQDSSRQQIAPSTNYASSLTLPIRQPYKAISPIPQKLLVAAGSPVRMQCDS